MITYVEYGKHDKFIYFLFLQNRSTGSFDIIINQLRKRGKKQMDGLFWINLIAFLLVTAYAVVYLSICKNKVCIYQTWEKVEFEDNVKERLEKFGSMYLDKRNY